MLKTSITCTSTSCRLQSTLHVNHP